MWFMTDFISGSVGQTLNGKKMWGTKTSDLTVIGG